MTSLRTSTRTPISTVPGCVLHAVLDAQTFSSQSAPRRPVAMTGVSADLDGIVLVPIVCHDTAAARRRA